MSYQHIKVWDDGPVHVVALNRPDKGNAITKLMAEEIQAAMLDFAASNQKVAVLTAMGVDVADPDQALEKHAEAFAALADRTGDALKVQLVPA